VPRPALVTGAAGFAGSYLLKALAAKGPVVAWTRGTPPVDASTVEWKRLDLLDRERVRHAVEELRPARVFHLAGSTHVGRSWSDPAGTLRANVFATHLLLDALRRAGESCRVLLTGSGAVYAPADRALTEEDPVEPTSPYAVSKLAQERLGLRSVGEDGLDVVLTRAFNHTGPGQQPEFAAPGLARQIALIERGMLPPVLKVGNLEARRDLTDVRDTVRAYVLVMEHGVTGTVYNVASGVARPVRALLEGLLARSTATVRVEVDPALLRPNDAPVFAGDASRLHALTGWTPEIGFERMLDDLLAYWRVRG
jgi:GDP-4-dehydro-6-deoxy-D-mannose reductase